MGYPKFKLEKKITQQQSDHLDEHGFLHFEGVANADEVDMIRSEIDRVAQSHIDEERKQIRGVPLFYGKDHEGKPWLQRLCFTSNFSDKIGEFVTDDRFEPVRALVGDDARIAIEEQDGVVVNRYMNVEGSVYPKLGWHTDGLRDLFYLRKPAKMLNVGLHLDDITLDDGGLRLIPGSHNQGFLSMCFRKPYFIWHKEDKKEVCVETKAGDLTVHDGRLWHRVAQSSKTGPASLRRSMYVPYQTGPVVIKQQDEKMPVYHRLGQLIFKRK